MKPQDNLTKPAAPPAPPNASVLHTAQHSERLQTTGTPEQIKEAIDYVVSKGYSVAAATKIVAEYGSERILADKASDGGKTVPGAPPAPAAPLPASPAQRSGKPFTGELVPGRTAVRVFDVDGNKPLAIDAMRDAGTELDIYIRLK
jgi:hypothetical protein